MDNVLSFCGTSSPEPEMLNQPQFCALMHLLGIAKSLSPKDPQKPGSGLSRLPTLLPQTSFNLKGASSISPGKSGAGLLESPIKQPSGRSFGQGDSLERAASVQRASSDDASSRITSKEGVLLPTVSGLVLSQGEAVVISNSEEETRLSSVSSNGLPAMAPPSVNSKGLNPTPETSALSGEAVARLGDIEGTFPAGTGGLLSGLQALSAEVPGGAAAAARQLLESGKPGSISMPGAAAAPGEGKSVSVAERIAQLQAASTPPTSPTKILRRPSVGSSGAVGGSPPSLRRLSAGSGSGSSMGSSAVGGLSLRQYSLGSRSNSGTMPQLQSEPTLAMVPVVLDLPSGAGIPLRQQYSRPVSRAASKELSSGADQADPLAPPTAVPLEAPSAFPSHGASTSSESVVVLPASAAASPGVSGAGGGGEVLAEHGAPAMSSVPVPANAEKGHEAEASPAPRLGQDAAPGTGSPSLAGLGENSPASNPVRVETAGLLTPGAGSALAVSTLPTELVPVAAGPDPPSETGPVPVSAAPGKASSPAAPPAVRPPVGASAEHGGEVAPSPAMPAVVPVKSLLSDVRLARPQPIVEGQEAFVGEPSGGVWAPRMLNLTGGESHGGHAGLQGLWSGGSSLAGSRASSVGNPHFGAQSEAPSSATSSTQELQVGCRHVCLYLLREWG